MKTLQLFVFLLLSLYCVSARAQVPDAESLDFTLKDGVGKTFSLSADFADKKTVVVAFLGTQCPLVKLYASRLQTIADKYAQQSCALIAINSNRQDSIAEIQHFARQHDLRFPVLKDPGNRVADAFGAERTPHVFVLNAERKIIYDGAIDDQYTYGIQKAKARHHYLANALKFALAGKKVDVAKTTPVGCIIGRQTVSQEHSDVTFSNQISRILQNRCVRCHRDGELAPFALQDYNEVVGWVGMIEEVVKERRMPPWHAESEPGVFKNDGRLTSEERDLLFRWAAAGAPQGDPDQMPTRKEFADGWQIGEPDMVIKMRNRPFKVPATGTVPYKYFQVDPGFKEDRWVKAAECRPGNRAVVHHIIVGVRGQGEFGESGGHGDLESEWIAATAPGAPPMTLPAGYAKHIPAGSKLIFQMHYTPNGSAQTDLSEIGLVFAKKNEVQKQVMTLMSFNDRIRIPPGDDNYRITSRFSFDQDVELMSMFPHMHFRGKKFRYEFQQPGQSYETLLNVPFYDFNWQNAYELKEYRRLPAGTKLRCIAHFDNSEQNLANPNPRKTVRWGDQTWDEMMIGYLDVAVPIEK